MIEQMCIKLVYAKETIIYIALCFLTASNYIYKLKNFDLKKKKEFNQSKSIAMFFFIITCILWEGQGYSSTNLKYLF